MNMQSTPVFNMKSIVWIGIAGMVAASLLAADSDTKSVIKSAAKKVAEKDNYSWNAFSRPEGGEQGFRVNTEGKTEKGGYTFLTLNFGDRSTDVALKSGKVAVKQEQEWKTADELEGPAAWLANFYKDFKVPAAEAEDLADKAKDLKAGAEGVYSGELSEQGIKDMFERWRRGGQGPEPKGVKGSVKFWVKDGALTKYEFNLQGKITFDQGQNEMGMNQTTTVEIKGIGTTKVGLPEEAKKKLL
jgi:hypothetical protein